LAEDVRELVERCLQGDEAAQRQLVRRFQAQVFGLCFRMLSQRQDAEDMAQETFVRALKSLGGWDSQRDFEPWLLAIAGNRCRTLLARRGRRPNTVTLDSPLPDPKPDLQAARQLAEEVDAALTILREEYRQAFLLFHEQQLSYAEISDVLDCPVGTVKTWIHRARRELVDRLRQRGVVQGGVVQEMRDAVRKI
jgi:RNA polymerase sigma-70 factor (ECF subfamily)